MWEPRSRAVIYFGYSPFHAGSVDLVLNPATGNVSPQFHLVFHDKFPTVQFMRDGTIPPHCTHIVQLISQRGSQENIDLKDNCFNPDLEEDPIKTPSNEPGVSP